MQILEEKYNELINTPKKNSNNSLIAPAQDLNRSKKKETNKNRNAKRSDHKKQERKKINLEPAVNPDHKELCEPQSCCACGESLENITSEFNEARQVFDVPQTKLEVTEYIQTKKTFFCRV